MVFNYRINRYFKAKAGYMLLCHYKASKELRNRYYIYAAGVYPIGNFSFSIQMPIFAIPSA